MKKVYLMPRRASAHPRFKDIPGVEFRVISHDHNGNLIRGPGDTYSLIGLTLGMNGLHEHAAYAQGFLSRDTIGLDGVDE